MAVHDGADHHSEAVHSFDHANSVRHASPALTLQEVFRLSVVPRRPEIMGERRDIHCRPPRAIRFGLGRMTCPERDVRRIGRRTLSCPQTGRRHSEAAPPGDIARCLPSASLKARPRLSVRRDHTLSPPARAVRHRGQDVRPPSTPRTSPNAVSRGTRMPTLERPSRQRRPQRATRRVHADTPATQLTTPQRSACSRKPRPTCPTSR